MLGQEASREQKKQKTKFKKKLIVIFHHFENLKTMTRYVTCMLPCLTHLNKGVSYSKLLFDCA